MVDLYPLVRPLLLRLPPERAHALTIAALQSRRMPIPEGATDDDPVLATTVWGIDFPNPVGLAAGFDKNAEVMDAMLSLGFGFVEVGGVTPRAQPGNPKPRVFRLVEDGAVINRLGFNNDGGAEVSNRIASWRTAARAVPGVLGVNLGMNKGSRDPASDYSIGAARFSQLADYLTINVSSPNTPGLRALQSRDALVEIAARTRHSMEGALREGFSDRPPALLLKIAPDLKERDLDDIADVVLTEGLIDGLVVCNTTTARPATLKSRHAAETGGLSGRPIAGLARALVERMARTTGGRVPIIGVGGISSGADAYAMIRAGASLVQLYTALIYGGPDLVVAIKRDLTALLQADGFTCVSDAVGADLDPLLSAAP